MLTHPVADMNAIARRQSALMLTIGDTNGGKAWTSANLLHHLTQSEEARLIAHILH